MLKIEDILREDFDWENVEIDEDEFDELETALIIDYLKKNTPKERQLLAIDWNFELLAIDWNFDNSKEVIKWIAEQPDTDKGTALFLYWYMNPQDLKKYKDKEKCEEYSWILEDYNIVETLEKNYLSGFYKNQKYAFDPKNDPYNSDYDWTEEVDEDEMKAKIPDVYSFRARSFTNCGQGRGNTS